MSAPKRSGGAPASPDEAFLERWSRRKADVRAGVEIEPDPVPPAEGAAAAPGPEEAPEAPPVVELPDLDSLHADSDYSAFMAPGVDELLRRKALRKLFSSPKFNVLDGLDDYCDDYTKYEALGDIVTADMKHHIERVAREAARVLEQAGQQGQPPAVAATPAPDASPAGEAAAAQQKDEHDGHEPPA